MHGSEFAAAPGVASSPPLVGTHSPMIEADWASFDPWRVLPLRHRMHEHPLLQLDRLMELGERMQRASKVRAFNNSATAGTDFNAASREHPHAADAVETLRRIAEAKAWMLLGNIQSDEVYRSLVDEGLDAFEAATARRDPGMFCRAGWIIVSSPHTVTPFHMDKGNGVLLHIAGEKTIHVWEAGDEVVSERARDHYHHHGSLDMVRWNEAYRGTGQVFRLKPGDGVFMPSTAPHMVETHDTPAITITLTYNTPRTRRNALLHATHDILRGKGVEPARVGARPLLDGVAYAGVRTVLAARELARRARGRPSIMFSGRYAIPAEYGDGRLSR